MAYIEKFLGKRVEIPEDRRYVIKPGLWVRRVNQDLVFGFDEPSMVLSGGINDLDWIVSEGQEVRKGESVLFAITGKIMYLDTPVGGTIHFNREVKQSPTLISQDPYNQGWLFKIRVASDPEGLISGFSDAQGYIESLQSSEGCKNPEGLKGGVSGICKAVYSGIREQKIDTEKKGE
jgi:glycine cleavage system H protein